MNQQQLRELLTVQQKNDYVWTALLPEISMMWAEGHSEEEAREKWRQEYDLAIFTSVFEAIQQERRAKHTPSEEDAHQQKRIERPETVDFPYRGHLYRIATNEGLPKRHIVLPHGTILVVCKWTGRVPSCLADIRHSPDALSPHEIAVKLDGVEALEVPLFLQTTKAMAILDFEGQRYAIDSDSHALVELPDGRLYRIDVFYPVEPVHIAEIIPFDPANSYMAYELKTFGKTPAIPVASDYPGMAHEPRDLRIRFTFKGEHYILSDEAYEQRKSLVFVPDHGFFRITSYLHSLPIKLEGLQPLSGAPAILDDVAVALRLADAIDVAD